MAGYVLEFEVFGDVQISRKLLRFGERAADARPAFRSIMDSMEDDIAKLFSNEGSSGGDAWAPLAESTLRRKERRGEGTAILQSTRALLDSLTSNTHASGIRQAFPDELVFGSSLMTPDGQYSMVALHQKGTENMPARKPLQFSETQKRSYVKELQRYVVEGFVG